MKCPYCENEMEEGALVTQRVPQWITSGEKKGRYLNVKKHFTCNEIAGYHCKKCNKIIIDK